MSKRVQSNALLSATFPPQRLGLCRAEAAICVAVGVTKFDQMVAGCPMPQPKQIDGRKVWSFAELELAFFGLPNAKPQGQIVEPDTDEWDAIA